MSLPARKVLLVGWDAADWKVIRPLLDRGEMPNLARLVADGVSGNLATIYPVLSPMLWTSIATGKRPTKHSIHGFSEPLPDGSGVRPITTLSRTAKAVWNILHQHGKRVAVVGWWPSHPAEPIRGVMVSNHFSKAGDGPEPARLLPAIVHPPEWVARLAELRVSPMELPGEVLRLFVPEYDKVDQAKDKRLHVLASIIAETLTLHAAATEVLEHSAWDFAAVYYDAIDHFGHGFMGYHPPRLPWISEGDFAIYQHVVANAYRYHDAMLGRLLQLAGRDATVIVMSDHGFHPDHLRPSYIPAEAAGPAVEHRHFGMICMCGPGLQRGETLYGATVLDVTPTLLHLFGLPVGRDMDGKVLVTAFQRPGQVEAIASWDDVAGDAGLHPPGARLDPVAAAEAMKQLVALGYVAPPGPDVGKNVDETVAELRYNLARAHDDAQELDRAIALYEELLRKSPDDQRVVDRLVSDLLALDNVARARAVLDAFDARCAVRAPEATAELERRQKERPGDTLEPRLKDADQREDFERRVLAEQATGFASLRGLLRLRVDLAEGRGDEVRAGLADMEALAGEGRYPILPRILAATYARLNDDARALIWVGRALERDADDWQALGLAARLHLRAGRWEEAVDAAAESLGLIYYQPLIHFAMGQALLGLDDVEGAERSLRVAVTQMPGLVPAHEALARLYDAQLRRPAEAALHRRRAIELREQAEQRRQRRDEPVVPAEIGPLPAFAARAGQADVEPERQIVVVAGLPRSGTSMLMQVLAAGGMPVLTDGVRAADADNPRGYLEYEPAIRLRQDASWVPQARGKAVKLVLPLLPFLPREEAYRVIVIDRDLREVLASQQRMLARLERTDSGAALTDGVLAREYLAQRERVRIWLEGRPDVGVLPLDYHQVLADPAATVAQLQSFLGRPLDAAAAAAAIDPALRRQGTAAGGRG